MARVLLEGVRKAYPSAAGPVPVVRGLDLEVPQGQILCLLGGSGCGKTTTLRMVAGLERPDAGTVAIGDRTVSGPGVFVPPEARGLGMVFQSYAIWPHLDVTENVAFPLRRRGAPDIEARVARALARLELGPLARRRPDQLSGGQQQRVALARALVADPAVLLLDEPLSNLDTRLRIEVRTQIRALVKERGTTAILVTHDHEEAFAVADRIAFLNAGVAEQVGSPRALYDAPATPAVARFFGVEELPATLSGEVATAAGVPVPARPLAPDGPCRLAFRSHDAALGAEGLPGVVVAATFLGGRAEVRVRVGDGVVAVPGEAPEGAAVRVAIRRALALPA